MDANRTPLCNGYMRTKETRTGRLRGLLLDVNVSRTPWSMQLVDDRLYWGAFIVTPADQSLCCSSTSRAQRQSVVTFTDELTLRTGEVLWAATAAVAKHTVGHDHLTAVETRWTTAHSGVDVDRRRDERPDTDERHHQQRPHRPVTSASNSRQHHLWLQSTETSRFF